MQLADEFFRLAHNDRTGRPLLSDGALGLGLAAALLGELAMVGRLTAGDGMIYVLDRHPTEDPLSHAVLDHLATESEVRDIRTWLAFVGRTAVASVGQRMQRAGAVRPQVSRRLFKQATIYVPIDQNAAAAPWARLSTQLRRQEPMNTEDAFLAGLAAATGMAGHILADPGYEAMNYFRSVMRGLPPTALELLRHTEAAVGEAVLTHRT